MPVEEWINDYVFVVHDFLSPSECQNFIQISEEFGYEDALVSSPAGQVVRKEIRNNERVIFQNEEIADRLWRTAADFVPWEQDGRMALGVNELLRFYRYDVGQRFNWHQDFPFERDNGEQSYLTLMVYLNDDFEGGETSFEDSYSDESFEEFQVVPKQGMALFFQHEVHHKGEGVLSGRKYVLRSDVMYSALEDESDSGRDYDDADDYDDDYGDGGD